MIVAHLKGDPETIAAAVQAIINSGKNIYVLFKTKANPDFIVIYGV